LAKKSIILNSKTNKFTWKFTKKEPENFPSIYYEIVFVYVLEYGGLRVSGSIFQKMVHLGYLQLITCNC